MTNPSFKPNRIDYLVKCYKNSGGKGVVHSGSDQSTGSAYSDGE